MTPQQTRFRSTLAGQIEHFLAYKRALGRRYANEERALALLDHYVDEHEIRSVHDVGSQLIEEFLASRPRPRPRSYNHLLGVVRRLFDWMVGQGVLTESPVRTTPRRRTGRRVPFLFRPDQARALLVAAESLEDNARAVLRGPTYRTAFVLMYGLGLRVGEVSRLQWRDVDFNQAMLQIRQTKFGKDRLVPFGPRIAGLLVCFRTQRFARGGELSPNTTVFSFTPRRPIHPGTFSQMFLRLVRRLDFDVPEGTAHPRLHDLRHSFAVGTLLRWYRAGLNPAARLQHLSTFMGHVDPASTAVYLTMTSELLQEASERFERFTAPVRQEV